MLSCNSTIVCRLVLVIEQFLVEACFSLLAFFGTWELCDPLELRLPKIKDDEFNEFREFVCAMVLWFHILCFHGFSDLQFFPS